MSEPCRDECDDMDDYFPFDMDPVVVCELIDELEAIEAEHRFRKTMEGVAPPK